MVWYEARRDPGGVSGSFWIRLAFLLHFAFGTRLVRFVFGAHLVWFAFGARGSSCLGPFGVSLERPGCFAVSFCLRRPLARCVEVQSEGIGR